MAKDLHFTDFKERISQLTDTEAVKEAYLAYLSSRFPRCRVTRTPPYLAASGLRLGDGPPSRVHDELVLIESDGKTSAMEMASWMDLARAAVVARLDKLLLTVSRSEQTPFFSALRDLMALQREPFVGLLIEMRDSTGMDSVLAAYLPPSATVYLFNKSALAAIIPRCDDLRSRWLAYKATTAMTVKFRTLGHEIEPAASVASWPQDATSAGVLVMTLQQGLQNALRLQALPDAPQPMLVFASEWVARGQRPGEGHDDGSAGASARTNKPGPDLRGGSARHLGEE